MQGHLDEKQCCIFPANEGADAGIDDGMPVSENHKAAKESGFTADGARAHARVGDAARIAGYCGNSLEPAPFQSMMLTSFQGFLRSSN